jgi:hypothetical protein
MKPNKELLLKTLQTIKDNPQHWNQAVWHCDTSHCFAGFAQLLDLKLPLDYVDEDEDVDPDGDPYDSGLYFKGTDTGEYAQEALGLRDYEAKDLFASSNTLADLEEIVNELITKAE